MFRIYIRMLGTKHSNWNSNHSKRIRSIGMKIPTIRKGFKAFECKFKPCETDLNTNSNYSKKVWNEAFECTFQPFERDLKHSNVNPNHSKGISSVQIRIWTIRKGFEAFKWKFEPLERIWSIRMQIRTIRNGFEAFECKFEPFERDSKHVNADSNNSKGIRIIQVQIRTIQKGFEAFECKF